MSEYYTNQNVRERIDVALQKIASLNAEIGTDSTEQDKWLVNVKMKQYKDVIELLDKEFYNETFL